MQIKAFMYLMECASVVWCVCRVVLLGGGLKWNLGDRKLI